MFQVKKYLKSMWFLWFVVDLSHLKHLSEHLSWYEVSFQSFAFPVFVAQEIHMQYAQVFKKYDAQHIEAFWKQFGETLIILNYC